MISTKARDFAEKAHREVNQLYGTQPYVVHLDAAESVGGRFAHLLPLEKEVFYIVRSAIYLHDIMEDCRVTYNDLKTEFGVRIADIVYAVTNEKGKTRKERANAKYYQGIRDTEFAVFVKLCDRIANVEAGGKLDMYRKEQKEFEEGLNGHPVTEGLNSGPNNRDFVQYFPMVLHLRELLK
jgi:(p)ppGpp synthase/HD superfamily hydrolase